MLSSFRNFSKSIGGKIVLVLFVVTIFASFALADISGLGGGALGGGNGTLVKTGDEQVSERDFTMGMERVLASARQKNPEATYATVAGNATQLIDQLTDDAAVKGFARETDMVISRKLIDAEIASLPQTRGLDGKFNQDAYTQFLAQQRLTDATVRRLFEGDLARRLMLGSVAANVRVPVGVATPYASMLLEERRGELVLVDTAKFRAGLAPTPADLQTYYAQNKQRYTAPEQRVLRIATIGPEQVAGVVPTEQQIAADYRANSALYGGRQTRVISQAVVPTKAAADGIVARARGGASFVAATAPAGFSAEDISVGPQTRQEFVTLAGAKVATPVFAAAAGAVVGPIQSDLGWHVVKVDAIRGEAGRSLAEARADIVTRLTANQRKDALLDFVAKVEEAIEGGSSIVEAAAANRLTLTETPLITGAGVDRANPAYRFPAAQAAALKAGFDLHAEDDPVVETLPNDAGYLLVGIGRVVEAAPAPLAQIRAQVSADWIAKQASDRARAVAAAIAAKVARGMPLADAAKQAGAGVSPARPFGARRLQLSQVPPEFAAPMRILFSLSAGKSRMVADPRGVGYFVVRAVSVTPGNAASQPGLISQVQQSFQEPASQELAEQFLAAVRKDVGVKRNEKAIAAARTRLTSTGN
ncbi:MAG: peptidylprolyl isomerase [Sphingomonas bacterium]|nr:peptidylprolyl isomerase [Sphingomonas bacterium]